MSHVAAAWVNIVEEESFVSSETEIEIGELWGKTADWMEDGNVLADLAGVVCVMSFARWDPEKGRNIARWQSERGD